MKKLLLFVSIPLAAHELYLMPQKFFVRAGDTIEVSINSGDSFPDSEVAPRLARLEELKVLSAKGERALTNLRVVGRAAMADAAVNEGGAIVLAVRTAPNFIELEPKKFEEYIRAEGLAEFVHSRPNPASSGKPVRERYTKFAKALLLSGEADGFYRHPVGYTLEIIPEKDPYLAREGARLPVQVRLRGRPAPNLQVEATHLGPAAGARAQKKIIGRTGADGRVILPITGVGKWRLHAIFMEPCADPGAAEWESYWASLTFEVR